MDIDILIEKLPDRVKSDVIDYIPVRLKTGDIAIRVVLDRILTNAEKATLKKAGCIGVDCICSYRYAPEIKKSYFYLAEV